MENIKVLEIGRNCPNCGSGQFAVISPNPSLFRPAEWKPNILGLADCRNCQEDFLVCLAPQFKAHILALIKHLDLKTSQELLGALFRS